MKYYEKVCPIRCPLPNDTFAFCLGEECAFFSCYAKSCSVPLIADILADSDICRNSFEPVERKAEE